MRSPGQQRDQQWRDHRPHPEQPVDQIRWPRTQLREGQVEACRERAVAQPAHHRADQHQRPGRGEGHAQQSQQQRHAAEHQAASQAQAGEKYAQQRGPHRRPHEMQAGSDAHRRQGLRVLASQVGVGRAVSRLHQPEHEEGQEAQGVQDGQGRGRRLRGRGRLRVCGRLGHGQEASTPVWPATERFQLKNRASRDQLSRPGRADVHRGFISGPLWPPIRQMAHCSSGRWAYADTCLGLRACLSSLPSHFLSGLC